MFTLSYVTYLQDSKRTMSDLAFEFDFVHDRLAQSLIGPVWDLDHEQIHAIISLEMRNKNILGIFFTYGDGFTKINIGFYRNSDDEIIPFPTGKERAFLKKNVFMSVDKHLQYSGVDMGILSLYFTDVPSRKTLARDFSSLILRTVMVTLLTLLLSFIYFRISILRPISMLTNTVMRFGQGEWSVRAGIRRDDELGALAAGFNEMAGRLETNEQTLEKVVNERTAQLVEAEKFAFLGTLVSGVAHEINTPIGIGITAVSYQLSETERISALFTANSLKRSELEKFMRDSLESSHIIETNLVRAGSFIQSFKRIAVDQSTEDKRHFKLGEYLGEIVFAMRPKLKKTGIKVVIECDENLEVTSYPGAISQIITNLIVNSLLHGFSEGMNGIISIKADIGSGPGGDSGYSWLTILYTDDGRGIAAENLKNLFTPFFTTLKDSGGTGLGLYIIQRTASSLGGMIACESAPGEGVKFTVRFPVEAALVGE